MSKPRLHKCPACGKPAFLLQRRERTHWTYIQVECDRAPDGCGKTSSWRVRKVTGPASILELMA